MYKTRNDIVHQGHRYIIDLVYNDVSTFLHTPHHISVDDGKHSDVYFFNELPYRYWMWVLEQGRVITAKSLYDLYKQAIARPKWNNPRS